jgi:hypothetical protein
VQRGDVSQASAEEPGPSLGPEELQRAVPDGVTLIYYMSEPQRLLVWVLTRERLQMLGDRWPGQTPTNDGGTCRGLEQNAPFRGEKKPPFCSTSWCGRCSGASLDERLDLIPDELVQRVPFAVCGIGKPRLSSRGPAHRDALSGLSFRPLPRPWRPRAVGIRACWLSAARLAR